MSNPNAEQLRQLWQREDFRQMWQGEGFVALVQEILKRHGGFDRYRSHIEKGIDLISDVRALGRTPEETLAIFVEGALMGYMASVSDEKLDPWVGFLDILLQYGAAMIILAEEVQEEEL